MVTVEIVQVLYGLIFCLSSNVFGFSLMICWCIPIAILG